MKFAEGKAMIVAGGARSIDRAASGKITAERAGVAVNCVSSPE